jgi:methylglutaconyl-CoA hydratase
LLNGETEAAPLQFVRLTQHNEEQDDGVLRVTMQRPELHNAFIDAMITELHTVFARIAAATLADTDMRRCVKAVVLTGAGKSFCAGADLNWMKQMVDYSEADNVADSKRLFDMFRAIRACPVPVVARVNGAAMGGGAGLVAACDIAVSSERAVYAFSECRLGLVPAVISGFVMEKIGAAQCARYFLTAAPFKAPAALAMGLVHEVASTDELDAAVNTLCAQIAGNSPAAVRLCKQLTHRVQQLGDVDATRDFVTRTIAQARVSSEGQQGLGAFLNKQPLPWATTTTATTTKK